MCECISISKDLKTMLSVQEAIEQIHSHGAKIANDSLRIIEPIVGIPVAQGDINLWMLLDLPEGCVETIADPQLAPGSTRGSRHCIKKEDLQHVKFFKLKNPNPLQGPILVFEKPTIIEHPEHGDHQWPVCIVAVTYQRRHSEEIRRVQD